jgi:hypothetical protein
MAFSAASVLAAGEHQFALDGVHLHGPLDDGAECPLDDVLGLLAVADAGEDLGGGKNRAETAQRHLFGRALGQAVQVGQGKVQAVGDLLDEGARAGGALAVHSKAQAPAVRAEMNDLVVLRAYVDDGEPARKVEECPGAVAGDFGPGCVGPGDVVAPVARGDHR